MKALYLVLFGLAMSAVLADNWKSQPGSIFQFGSASAARQTFYKSGSCGLSTYFANKVPKSNNTPLVAMPISVMRSQGSSQNNKYCARTIQIKGPNGVTRNAIIADTNMSGENSIDMTLDLWTAFGRRDGDGSLLRVQWKFV